MKQKPEPLQPEGNSFEKDVLQIKASLLNELPGHFAQQKLAPYQRTLNTREYLKQYPCYKTAGVMILIYPVHIQTMILLIERSDQGNHPGQISLPGGKMETGETILQAAIRETREEIGVRLKEEDILGALTEIFIPPSGYLVHPFAACLQESPEIFINQSEVKRIIEIPLRSFANNFIIQNVEFKNSEGTRIQAPCYRMGDLKIWGATAMIISEFVSLLK